MHIIRNKEKNIEFSVKIQLQSLGGAKNKTGFTKFVSFRFYFYIKRYNIDKYLKPINFFHKKTNYRTGVYSQGQVHTDLGL